MMENLQTLRDCLIYSVESRPVWRYKSHIWALFHRTVLMGQAARTFIEANWT
jgi:hypothetical protein